MPAEPTALSSTSTAGIEEPVFAEPWQAKLFAMTLTLSEVGLFSWAEWTNVLGRELGKKGEESGPISPAGDTDGYYRAWLSALQQLLAERSVASETEIAALAEMWHAAAHATPHGSPIRLENAPAPHLRPGATIG